MADRYKCIQGHFTDREHDGKSCPYDKITSEELSELETQEIEDTPKYEEKKVDKKSLTSQEWALWYKAVAENKALGYWAEELSDGTAILKVENGNNHKLIITSGSFEKPKANAVYSFKNANEMNDYIEVLKSYDKK